jgi:hypothetical protein
MTPSPRPSSRQATHPGPHYRRGSEDSRAEWKVDSRTMMVLAGRCRAFLLLRQAE